MTAAGCEEPDGRSDIIPWWTVAGWPEPSRQQQEFVEETFGMEMVREDQAFGAVTFFFSDDVSQGWGSGTSCTPHASGSGTKSRVIAHELGHVLGLEHVDDPENLMYPNVVGGTELTDEQLDKTRLESWNLQQCR